MGINLLAALPDGNIGLAVKAGLGLLLVVFWTSGKGAEEER